MQKLSEQEDLIVWMRTASLSTFRKLYGRIEVELEVDDFITVEIQNNYNVYSFGGKKSLVLSTTSWLGGKNDFLGKAYIFIGLLSMLLAVIFFIADVTVPRYACAVYASNFCHIFRFCFLTHNYIISIEWIELILCLQACGYQ